ncbi:MAG: DUF3536 domain-containing protein [Chloroflexota bacterium]
MGQQSICVHGHFYQPLRVNPFTGKVPVEPGAEPYHDFNEKITAECYRPNALEGNFDNISFNLGPTLAAWLEKNDPTTYEMILAADRRNVERFGVGNAIAQAYNHTILPLATDEDRHTQVAWGLADFRHRFGRDAEGMWLGETAADWRTLEVLVDHGVQFVVLAPWQAHPLLLDTSEPYLIHLPSGRSLAAFFFDAELSKQLTFNPRMTRRASDFAELCLPTRVVWYKQRRSEPQLVFIAVDGEVFGHHQKRGVGFLSQLLRREAPRRGFTPTTLARYWREHPPKKSVMFREDAAWSCYHGLNRWSAGCACTVGDSAWKPVLRRALDKLAMDIDRVCAAELSAMGIELAMARREYVQVILGKTSAQTFALDVAGRPLAAHETARAAELLEAQYWRQLMFTSCGFFFEDIDRIEPANNLAFAAKALDLLGPAQAGLEDRFRRELSQARSWRTGRSGKDIYDAVRTRL